MVATGCTTRIGLPRSDALSVSTGGWIAAGNEGRHACVSGLVEQIAGHSDRYSEFLDVVVVSVITVGVFVHHGSKNHTTRKIVGGSVEDRMCVSCGPNKGCRITLATNQIIGRPSERLNNKTNRVHNLKHRICCFSRECSSTPSDGHRNLD